MKALLFAVSATLFAQVPMPTPTDPPKPLKPEEIRGTVTNPRLLLKPGASVPPGRSLEIEFDYETDAPGKSAVAAEIRVGGKPHRGFGHNPFQLSEKAGQGRVRVTYMVGINAPDVRVDEVVLYLFPLPPVPGRREVATIQGSIRFEGVEAFTAAHRKKIAALEREVAELREAVRRLEKKLGLEPAKGDAKTKASGPFKLTAEEQELVDLTNGERKKAELPPLKANAKLFAAARAHSANMAAKETLNHELDGKNFDSRVKDEGYRLRAGGENIALGQRTPSEAIVSWMNSEGHKANILSDRYTEVGVAVGVDANGRRYWTQVFATPLEE